MIELSSCGYRADMGCAMAYCVVLNAVTDLTYPNRTAHNNGKNIANAAICDVRLA